MGIIDYFMCLSIRMIWVVTLRASLWSMVSLPLYVITRLLFRRNLTASTSNNSWKKLESHLDKNLNNRHASFEDDEIWMQPPAEGFARFPRISIQAVYRESDRLTIIKIKNSLFSNISLIFASLKFRGCVFITQ